MFETTIRYLGGLLSAYELSGQKFPVLLQKAKEVADKMAFAWVGVSGELTLGCAALMLARSRTIRYHSVSLISPQIPPL